MDKRRAGNGDREKKGGAAWEGLEEDRRQWKWGLRGRLGGKLGGLGDKDKRRAREEYWGRGRMGPFDRA